MTTIGKFKKYFAIYEIVSREVYNAYGDRAYRFFDPRLMANMVWLREKLGKPIKVNNWLDGGKMEQRGLRENTSRIVMDKSKYLKLYLSAHTRGSALDFDVKGMTANEVRDFIVKHEDEMPYKCRLERKLNGEYITWVHLDVDDEPQNPKVYLFDV